MNTKLTLRLDAELIERAKQHSTRTGKSVSSLVADFFALMESGEAGDTPITPSVRSLLGALSGPNVDEGDYRRHLEDKHR
jgi:hypothetical protein